MSTSPSGRRPRVTTRKNHTLRRQRQRSWDETAEALEETEAVTDDATVVSDAEKALVDAFESGDRSHQLDLVHVGRTLGYKLWKDDAFPLSERKAIVSGVTDDLFHLKNSVALHAPRNERLAIRERIDQTLENLGKEAWRLERQDSPKATAYLREWAEATVTFAELALDQQQVPWTSNVVERAMGEVSKRCKNQWMQWSEAGLESLLWLNLCSMPIPSSSRRSPTNCSSDQPKQPSQLLC